MRRLAKDHAALRKSTPPNYLFPDGDECVLPDDLTALIILVTGAHGTPYSQGLWKLHLRIPADYPKSPPKAMFKTRIYHPNVEESTGAVCLDTLKKDWESKLTLKDILVTISCLLIHPNPDSALNSEAGSLLQEDYDAFSRKAKLMTSIHAPIPNALKDAVMEAKRRGEDDGVGPQTEKEERPTASKAISSSTSVIMKKRLDLETSRPSSSQAQPLFEDEAQEDDTKENDPSHLPRSASKPPPSPRKVLGKRALSDFHIPFDADQLNDNIDTQPSLVVLESNTNSSSSERSEPLKKSPKLRRSLDEVDDIVATQPEEESIHQGIKARPVSNADDKENIATASTDGIRIQKTSEMSKKIDPPARPTLRKVSNVGSSRGKGVPRVGIRRL